MKTIISFLVFCLSLTTAICIAQTQQINNNTISQVETEIVTGHNIIRIFITNQSNMNWDEAIILFNTGAGTGVNAWDSQKMFTNNPIVPEIWTKEGNVNLAINSLPGFSSGWIMPVYINAQMQSEYKISFNLADFDSVTTVIMEDVITGNLHDIRTGEYIFTDENTVHFSRFLLHFNPVPTAIADVELSNTLQIHQEDNCLIFKSEKPAKAEIYNISGQLIHSVDVYDTSRYYLQRGFYIVRLFDGEELVVRKVFH